MGLGVGVEKLQGARAAVLVIDDEPGIRDLLRLELTDMGYEVATAEDGQVGIELVKRRKFDLVVTDLKMPGMDGIEVLESLRAIDPELEIIVATGYASVATAVQCMKAGAYDYIEKPYDIDQLTMLLERALQKVHLQSVVALYEASRSLLSTLRQSQLVPLAVSLAQQVLHADDVGLLLSSDRPGAVGSGAIARLHRLASGPLVPDAVVYQLVGQLGMASVDALCVPSPAHEMPELALAGGAGGDGAGTATSALVYRLSGRTGTLGALVLLRGPRSRPFSPPELQKGTVFAHQVALSLDNARLHEQLEQRIIELTSTREQLVQAEKLALAGYLASSVAHEVNNPLTVLRTGLDALRDFSPVIANLWAEARAGVREPARVTQLDALVSDLAEIVDASLDSVKRIGDLVSGFRQLSRPNRPGPRERIDVNQIVRDCLASLAGGEPDHRPPVLALSSDPCEALVCGDDLRTSLLSLLAFLRGPGRPAPLPGDSLCVGSEVIGGRACVTVHDSSLRLSADERRHLFDPRVEIDTSAGRTMRLNLALPLAYQLLQRNGAEITLSGEHDRGFAFRVVLPPVGSASELGGGY